MTQPFWAGGAEAYRHALKEHYQSKIAELESRLALVVEADERSEITNEIETMRQELQSRLRLIPGSLF